MWPTLNKEQTSILCKTTGMGALIRLMSDIHKNLPVEIFVKMKSVSENRVDEDYIKNVKTLMRKLYPHQYRLFSVDKSVGQFNGTGGKGLEGALYKEMKKLLGLN